MRIHVLLSILILTLGLCVLLPQLASAETAEKVTLSEAAAERAVLRVFNSGRALQQIDAAFASGALTWAEAQALYAEQSLIRNAYVRGKVTHGRGLAARRAAFMLRTSQSTYARLAFNSELRRPMQRQVTWVW